MRSIIIIIFLVFISKINFAQDTITSSEVKLYIGKKVLVCDRVNHGRLVSIPKTGPTVLYVGPDHPNHYLSLVFPKSVLRRFSFDPEKKMINKRFCVTGRVSSYDGKPAIYIRSEGQVNEEE